MAEPPPEPEVRIKGDKTVQCFGYKRGMTTLLQTDGRARGVTLIELVDATVTQVKTEATDGYTAVQLGFDTTKEYRLTQAEAGHLKSKNGGSLPFFKHLTEVRDVTGLKVGDLLPTDLFTAGNQVSVQAITKGKGTQGVMKRHRFHGQERGHGAEQVHRKPMTGGATDPARVMPGSGRPGKMGNETQTILNLRILDRNDELKLIAVEGGVPGPTGSLVRVIFGGTMHYTQTAADRARVGQQKQKARKK